MNFLPRSLCPDLPLPGREFRQYAGSHATPLYADRIPGAEKRKKRIFTLAGQKFLRLSNKATKNKLN
jgi:hypothetical protein